MPLVESKKFFTKKIVAYAIAQFIFTLLIYFGLYHLNYNLMEAAWWRGILLVIILSATFNGLAPALLREESKKIRLEGERNPIYFIPIAVLLFESAIILIKMYYLWDLEITKYDISIGLLGYLLAVPTLSAFLYYTEKDI